MRILIEVPTYDGRIAQCTSESLWRLDKRGHTVDYKPRTGYGCDMARNRIAADALCAGYDYVLMVDNDIAFKPESLGLLLEHEAEIALGYYLNRYARGEERLTTLYHLGYGWEMYEAAELAKLREQGTHKIAVKGGGMGFALFKASVFERIPFPWYKWTDISFNRYEAEDVYECRDDFQSGGEDINFCNLARNAGIEIAADTRVACGHEFRRVVWPL